MRAKVRARENDFTLAVKASGSEDMQEVLTGIVDVAFSYTGHYLEGDTLRFSHSSSGVTATRPTIDGQLYYQYKIRLDYLTTIYQENQLESLLGDLMYRFDFTGADDASKAFAIYDYLCRNVRFEDLEYL